MNRRGLALGAAAGLCALLAATLAARSPATKTLHTTGGRAGEDVAAPVVTDSGADAPFDGANDLPPVPGSAGSSGTARGRDRQKAAPSDARRTPKPDAAATPTTTTVARRPPVRGPLRTDGNRILDADGHTVVLRGIQRVGFQIPGKWPPITDAEMAHAHDWGANVVRLPLGEAYLDPKCANQYVPDYLDSLDRAVQSITSQGMVAILDLSFVTRTPCGESFRWRMADAGSIPFWLTIAQRYKDNPLVVFDLFNEPHDINNDVWRNGGEVQDPGVLGSVRWTAAGMQQLYDAVRSTGAANVVTVAGNGYGGSPAPILDGHRLDGYNIVYAMHAYTCSEPDPNAFCTSNPSNQQPEIASGWLGVAASYPVMITEFGWPNRNDGRYNARVIHIAQGQNPPWGWVAFAWSGRANGDFALIADIGTYAPTSAGAPVKAALTSLP